MAGNDFRFIFADAVSISGPAGIKRQSSHPRKCRKEWMLRLMVRVYAARAKASPLDAPAPAPLRSAFLQRAFAAFTYRDFRVLWFGAFASTVGTWMQKVAQSWLVFELTKSSSVLPGARRFPRPAADPALHDHRRGHRGSPRSAAAAARLAVRADGHRLHAGPLVFTDRVQIWHILALSFTAGHRAGVRRPGLPVADPVARAQEGSAERDRAQLDPVQPRARVRAAALPARRWPRSARRPASGSTACRSWS